jgi:uncharacterized membrane protein
MKQYRIVITILLTCLFIISTTNVHAQTNLPVVRAVLFYSPTCPHCQLVINDTLLPLLDKYGNQLQIIGLDISQPQGQQLFLNALNKFGLDRGGVPFLVIDNIHLVGSVEIPERFPGMVETYLKQGGVDWPDISGLSDILPTPTEPASPLATLAPASVSPAVVTPTATPALGLSHEDDPTWRERFAHDPAGNTLAVLVLAGMLGALVWAVKLFQNTTGASIKGNWARSIPVLCAVGFGVAGYLAYVETAHVDAVCGPVGDCNTVQQSEYARLFGILPIGVLGLMGYAAILIAWGITHYGTGRLANLAVLSMFVMTASGTLFSIYLTFLEPFVIGATCAWCLTSAVLMTILMLLSVLPAKLAFSKKPFAASHPSRHTRRSGAHDD